MTFGIVETYKGRFIIEDDAVRLIGAISKNQLNLQDIKGYTVNDNYILIEPHTKDRKRIKVSTYVSKKEEIIEWLAARYPNLDALNILQEEQEILSNEELGFSVEQREEKLSNARKTAKILNWTGGLVGIWTLLWPQPYEYAILASIITPLISIVTFKFFRGLIRIDQKNNSSYPSIFWSLFGPCLAICIRVLLDYNIFDYHNIWFPSIGITVGLMFLLISGNNEFNFKQPMQFLNLLGIALFIFAYSYGSVVSLNCQYDKSEPEIFSAKITNKRVSSGKTTTYHFELEQWGPQEETDEVNVSKELYDRLNKNDSVYVFLKKGKFEIPWLIVTD
jgi:hypothetical protein